MYTMITAHSGCDGTPDNSLEFIRHALSCGADALEVDVRLRDGQLYLSHDASALECPSLEDAFRLLKGSTMQINCDLKEADLEEPVLELASKIGVEELVLFSGDVSPAKMKVDEKIRRKTLMNLHMLFGSDTPWQSVDLEQVVERCRDCGASVINIHYRLCTDELLDRMEQAGIGVSAWTVNDEAVARRLLERKLYNITSRVPGMVLSLR